MKTINNFLSAGCQCKKMILIVIFAWCFYSCQDFIQIDPPRTDLVRSTVFESDLTAKAAMTDVYYQMSTGLVNGSSVSMTFLMALSSDEVIDYYTDADPTTVQNYKQFNDNTLTETNLQVINLWSEPYQYIYKANAILEGISSSSELTDETKIQLEGEAKFIRAFSYFYLTGMFGDVPLALTTDYRTNASLPRTTKADVFHQIVLDLTDAQRLLPDDYSVSNGERVRANKNVATAMLARVYLFMGNYSAAESSATDIIGNISAFSLCADPDSVFLKNSTEAIWQVSNDNGNAADAATFYTIATPRYSALRSSFVESFETGDLRSIDWIGTATDGESDYYFPMKYKATEPSPITEYSMVLRLAEQYLIRAEARTQLGNIAGAQSDLNMIRTRAGLANTLAGDVPSLLAAVADERKFELFTEWGHRWLDLNRTGKADAVLSPLKPGWAPSDALYPIPQIQLLNDAAMANAQNPGY